MQNNTKNTLQSLMAAVRENENLIKGYASKKCNQCLGRGYIEIKEPGSLYPVNYLCRCVEKNVKKEFKEA